MSVADPGDAYSDWLLTVGLQLGQMSPTNIADRFLGHWHRRPFFWVGDQGRWESATKMSASANSGYVENRSNERASTDRQESPCERVARDDRQRL